MIEICLRRRYNDSGHLDRWEHWDAATGSMQSWSWRKNDAASFVLSAGTRTSLGDADWRLDFIFSPSLNARTPLGPATASAGSQERQILGWQMDQVDNCQLFLHFIGIYLKASKPKTGKLHFQHLAAWYGRMRAYSEESQNWASLLFVIYISPHRNRHIHIVGISCQ